MTTLLFVVALLSAIMTLGLDLALVSLILGCLLGRVLVGFQKIRQG